MKKTKEITDETIYEIASRTIGGAHPASIQHYLNSGSFSGSFWISIKQFAREVLKRKTIQEKSCPQCGCKTLCKIF